MTETAHLILGAAIASKMPNPILASILAVGSHIILDIVPHWDTGTNWRKRSVKKTVLYTGIDLGLGTAIGLVLFAKTTPLPYLLFIMFLSTLPDWLEAPYFFGFKIPPFSSIYKIQHILHKKKQLPWGLITQLAFLAVLLFILFLPSLSALAK